MGITLNFKSEGKHHNQTILFIHPLGADHTVFDNVINKMKNNFNCISVDLRGHGKSPVLKPPYSIKEMAEDISSTFNFGSPINIMGVSIGGMIAMSLAINKLIPVSKLILSDTGHKIGNFELWQERIDLVKSGGLQKIVDMALERWFPKEFRDKSGQLMEACKKLQLKTQPKGYVGACQAIQTEDLTSQLQLIKQETLIITGSEDISTPPKLGKELAGLVQNSSYQELKGIGHVPPIQDPHLTIEILDNFLR